MSWAITSQLEHFWGVQKASFTYFLTEREGCSGRRRNLRGGSWVCSPGITEMALKALSTRNVRRAEKFPRFTNSVTYLRFFLLRERKNMMQNKVTETDAIEWPIDQSKAFPTSPCYFVQTSTIGKNQKADPRFGSIHSRHDDNTEIQPVPRIS